MAFGEEQGGGQPVNMEALIKKVLLDEESRKKQEKKIDNMEHNLRTIGRLICDENGKCRLATKQDLGALAEKQEVKSDLSQLSGQELWNQIKGNPTYVKDVGNIHLKKLKENETYLREALNDPEIVERIADVVCNDEGCKIIWNTSVDKAKAGKAKGQKEHFLIKKK